MGAWGLGIFQSDHDYDLIAELAKTAGLPDIEARLKAAKEKRTGKPEPQSGAIGRAQTTETEAFDGRIHLSMYAKLCTDVETVRKHLESSVLTQMFAELERKFLSGEAVSGSMDYPGYCSAGYMYVLLGACAMTLGCKLDSTVIDSLKRKHLTVGFMRDALKQLDRALYGNKRYRNGNPYNFGSRCVRDTTPADIPEEDKLCAGSNMINVQPPGNPLLRPEVRKQSDKELADIRNKLRANPADPEVFKELLKQYTAHMAPHLGLTASEASEQAAEVFECLKDRPLAIQ